MLLALFSWGLCLGHVFLSIVNAWRPFGAADADRWRGIIGPRLDSVRIPVYSLFGGGKSLVWSTVVWSFLLAWWATELTVHLSGAVLLAWALGLSHAFGPVCSASARTAQPLLFCPGERTWEDPRATLSWALPLLISEVCVVVSIAAYVRGARSARRAFSDAFRAAGVRPVPSASRNSLDSRDSLDSLESVGFRGKPAVLCALWDAIRVLLVVPLPARLAEWVIGVRVVRGLRYGVGLEREPHERRRLDVWHPVAHSSPSPDARGVTLVYVHGGAWVSGDKHMSLPRALVERLVSRGFTVASVNYRLFPKGTMAEMLEDVKLAIATVRLAARGAHERYSGPEWSWARAVDPARIFVMGGSAGGHLAALAAVSAGDRSTQPGFEPHDASVAGCVSLYGVHDFLQGRGATESARRGMRALLERFARTSDDALLSSVCPASRIAAGGGIPRPPMLLVHGVPDNLVPLRHSVSLSGALDAAGEPNVLVALPGAHHAYDITPSPRALVTASAIQLWIHHVLFGDRDQSQTKKNT